MLDGQKKVIVCSKRNYLTKSADITLDALDMKEVYIEIDICFDLEPTYDDEEAVCSPVGL